MFSDQQSVLPVLSAERRARRPVGVTVAVRGILEDQLFGAPVIDAKDVMTVQGEMSELAASELLLYRQRLGVP